MTATVKTEHTVIGIEANQSCHMNSRKYVKNLLSISTPDEDVIAEPISLSELPEDAPSSAAEHVVVERELNVDVIRCAGGKRPEWSCVFNSF